MRVLISAGEASGENYGALLVPALREVFGRDTEFFGVGGERMRAAGCEIVVDSSLEIHVDPLDGPEIVLEAVAKVLGKSNGKADG